MIRFKAYSFVRNTCKHYCHFLSARYGIIFVPFLVMLQLITGVRWCKVSPDTKLNVARLPRLHSRKEFACPRRRWKILWFHPWIGKILWRSKGQPTPVFLSRKLYGQRSLESYSPLCRKELDPTEELSRHAHKVKCKHLYIDCLYIRLAKFPLSLSVKSYLFFPNVYAKVRYIKR